ncbi:hypothetical protein LWC33_10150 [Pseudonocardia sp. RS11V-5]|uniref:hypothetical protein n=1 Tax=Pseudonocardia terrae TaxID=2905831 RepID=UPI001E3896AD|nr:hypothetical protein [Pseudonocardia terrae]MCE3551816.1 hypothetical protein [Pseudonocardia terrae]
MDHRYETVVTAVMALATNCDMQAAVGGPGAAAWRDLGDALFSAVVRATDPVLPDGVLHHLAEIANDAAVQHAAAAPECTCDTTAPPGI